MKGSAAMPGVPQPTSRRTAQQIVQELRSLSSANRYAALRNQSSRRLSRQIDELSNKERTR